MATGAFSLEPVSVPSVNTQWRRIVTPLPVPESLPILETIFQHEARAMHGQLPIVWDRAEGVQVSDKWGNTWLDFTSTIFVANAGHGNQRIVHALAEQLAKPLLHSYTYATEIRAEYLRTLIEKTPPQFEKAFLLSAGTEATECALKLMRIYSRNTGKRRPIVVCFSGNWHGRTMGAQLLSDNPAQREWIGHTDPNIFHLPFPYPWLTIRDPKQFFADALEDLFRREELDPDHDLCGFLLETFQGWGAVFYPPGFVQAVAAYAADHGALLAFDEMQAGFGRTGKLFGYMHYGVEPDLICCGKGASSSVPLSMVLGRQALMDLPETGSMSSTHSANPLACAAGLANLITLFDDGLVENSARLGRILHNRLDALRTDWPHHISSVQGNGLLAALIFSTPDGRPLPALCDTICEDCMRAGLLVVHTGRESIKLAPPLCITEPALHEGLEVLTQAIARSIATKGPHA